LAVDLEFHLQAPSGLDGEGILQNIRIIVLEPDFKKLIGDFQDDGVAVDFPGLMGANHIL
jgi:hypothetical protein